MGYEVEIRCDARCGNPLEKKRCLSDAQARVPPMRHEARTSREAIYAVEMRARNAGWIRLRGAERPNRWICPVCQEAHGAA